MWEEEAFELEFSRSRLFLRETVLCNSPASVQFALSQHNASFERKSPQMRNALAPLLGDGLFISDGETWKTRRRMVAPIVHVSRMSVFAPRMVEAATELRESWLAREGQTLDALAESAHLAAEVICRCLFGRALGHDFARQIVEGFSAYQREIDRLDVLSLLGVPDWVPRRQGRPVLEAVARIHAVLDEVVESHRRRADAGEDSVIGRLIDARDPETGAPLGREALRNEIAVLFMAGHETTANTMAWVWYLLSQAPDVEARLHAEIDTVLAGRPATLADMPKLVYTRAILDETMRLYPPVPILPREALRDERFEGHAISKGAIVLVVPWLLHRHRKLWDDPDAFIPERFLGERGDRISKFAYLPFSVGPRVCAGMAFGMTEAVLGIATLVQAVQLRLAPGTEVKPVCRLTLRPENGLPMVVHRRGEWRGGAATNDDAAGIVSGPPPGCPFHHG